MLMIESSLLASLTSQAQPEPKWARDGRRGGGRHTGGDLGELGLEVLVGTPLLVDGLSELTGGLLVGDLREGLRRGGREGDIRSSRRSGSRSERHC